MSSTGGPPTNRTSSGGPPGGGAPDGFVIPEGCPPIYKVYIEMAAIAQEDCGFKPNIVAEVIILILMIIIYIPPLILYIINRNNLLIRYRQPKVVFIGGCLSALNNILSPIIRMTKIKCLFNTWFCSSLIFGYILLTFSRYTRTYYMQRLSIFKLRFSTRKNKKELPKNELYNKTSGSLRIKEEGVISQKSNSFLPESNFSYGTNGTNDDSFGIADPVAYFKKLNSIINRKITIILVIIPVVALTIYYTILTIRYWDPDQGTGMLDACPNEFKDVNRPKIALSVCIIVTSFYMFYEAYYKQKWDMELRIEYTIFVLMDAICFLIMELTVEGYMGRAMIRNRVYIFQMFALFIHIVCIVVPLLKILFSKLKKKDDSRLTEEEFLEKLSNPTFREQVRDISNHTFCIENLLFFIAHWDLMNIVIQYYAKKGNGGGILPTSNSYSSSDVLHKNTINPSLYKDFDPIFKPQYEQIYNLYINEEGIASVNIKSSTIKTIEEQMENDNYTYLMFSQAAEEVGELLYNNIYPRMK